MTAEKKRKSRLDSFLDKVADAVNDQMPDGVRDDGQGRWSFDACRFRREEHCFYPTEWNEAASQEAGYIVWVPVDRGYCMKSTWDDQRACEMYEPGPNSGDPNALIEATVAWEDGGQRDGVPVAIGHPNDPSNPEISAQLSRLARLHSTGSLSDDEFAQAKAAILGSPPSAGESVQAVRDPVTSAERCDHRDSTSRTFCTTCGVGL
jgi:hypothetical protein